MKDRTTYSKRRSETLGSRLRRTALIAVVLATLGGCLGEPDVDERWTLLEIQEVSPGRGLLLPADQPIDVSMKARITYRSILTGFIVAEVRYSDSIAPASVQLDPDDHTLEVAADVDRILANSVTAGRATRIFTGFDHLMQEIDLSFAASAPSEMYAGGSINGGLYLVLYMGAGDEIELPSGADSLVVTPFVSTDKEVLHTGFALNVTPPGGASQP